MRADPAWPALLSWLRSDPAYRSAREFQPQRPADQQNTEWVYFSGARHGRNAMLVDLEGKVTDHDD